MSKKVTRSGTICEYPQQCGSAERGAVRLLAKGRKRMDIKAVIFDMDGLLIDTEKHLVESWTQAAREFGYPFTREHGLMLRSLTKQYAAPLLKEIFDDSFDYFTVRERRKQIMEEKIKKAGIERKPGAKELLAYLHKRGIKTAVATATDLERAERYLKEVDLWGEFDKVVCVSMVKIGKPEPDVYIYACEQIGEDPKDCMALEDSPNGIRSACAAGLKPVMVPDLTEPDEEISKLLYAKAVTLADVIDILEKP